MGYGGVFPQRKFLQYLRTLYILEGHSISLNIKGLLGFPRNQQNKLITFIHFYMFGNKYIGFESFTLKIDGKEQNGRAGRHRIHLLPNKHIKNYLYIWGNLTEN